MLVSPTLSIPSPGWSGFSLGPFEVHAYALCILLGMAAAIAITTRRMDARGQDGDFVMDAALLAIPLGIIGARLYHVVITDPGYYFGSAEGLMEIPQLWKGGLGIMGGVAFGALAVWIMCRVRGTSYALFADCVAPALLVAQALGRWGNWFNQELFGRATTLPWGLEIAPTSPNFPDGLLAGTLFHPTFLYESLWNLLGAALIIWLGRSRRTAHRVDGGRSMALYLIWYGTGRMLIEIFLRIDPSAMFLGVRIHVFTAAALIVVGLLLYAWLSRRKAAVLGSVAEHPASTRAANGSGSHRAVAAARQSDAAVAPGVETASEPWRGARINRLPDLDRADRTAAAAEPEPDSAELGEQADPSGDVRLQAFVETRAADPSRQPVRG
ncbi:MAG: prolipoprotein diacylglyceryl transferase [Kocuria palustris]|nr:MAG: prolipoprotein diacylglyceryl transferase [Kocuria palustris]